MSTLNKKIKEITKMVLASELNLLDTGGYFMNRARWNKITERDEGSRKNRNNIDLIIKGRNRVIQAEKEYKAVKRKEL